MSRRVAIDVLAVLVAVLSLFPIALVAATKPIRWPHPQAFDLNATLIPESSSLHARAVSSGSSVQLRWQRVRPAAGKIFYAVYRASGRADTACGPVRNAPDLCGLYSQQIATTRSTQFADHPGKGTWTYRVGITVNWLNDVHYGDVYLFSQPLVVTVD